MATAQAIYDYFTPLEEALADAFALAGLTCYTPLGAQVAVGGSSSADGATEFERKRPRVEIVLLPGSNRGFLRAYGSNRAASGHLREQARRASLAVRVITEAVITTHRVYLAQVLYLLDTIAPTVNASAKMPDHEVASLSVQGGTVEYAAEDGHFETILNCEIDFGVREAAWLDLET